MSGADRDTLRALSQAGAGGGVVVKPLEWADFQYTPLRSGLEARTSVGVWRVFHFDEGWAWWSNDGSRSQYLASKDEAKTAAEADYSARILATLASSQSAREPSCDEQLAEAKRLAANIGYMVVPDPVHADGEVHAPDFVVAMQPSLRALGFHAVPIATPPAPSGEVVRTALERLRDDCQSTIDLYHRNGPSFTSPGGDEYEPTSFVIEKMEELIAVAETALSNPAPGHGEGGACGA